MQNELTDEELALLVQNGEKEKFGILISRYETKLERYLRKFLQNTEDIEDLLQDIFIKAYTNIQSFDTKLKFNSWIYRIAHNEAVNALKKNTRRPFSFDFLDPELFFAHPEAKERADEVAEREIIKNNLDNILENISPKYREIVVLYFYEELSYKEISDVLKIPTSLVGVRLQRGKNEIKKLLENKV